jgi:putative DNA primase/helicase
MEYLLIFKPCLPLTPVGFGERVANMYRGRLFYMADTKTWLLWNGNKFQNCGAENLIKLVRNCIKTLLQELGKNQIGKANEKIVTRNDLIKAADVYLFTNRLNEIIKILPTIDGVITAAEDFDCIPTMINCKNGMVDMRTGEILPSDPSFLVSQSVSVIFNPSAICSSFSKFITDICDNDIEMIKFMQVFCGYLFTGLTTEQRMFVFYGLGANGKSLLSSILLSIAGDYGMSTPASTLLAGRAGAIRNDYARLVNSRIVYCEPA